MAIVLIAIGLLFTGVDFMVGSGISYPDFIQPTGLYHGIDIHPRIQQYVTQNILGHNLQVDILRRYWLFTCADWCIYVREA